MNYKNLIKYGLTDRYAQEATLYDGFYLARVTAQHRDLYKVAGEEGELQAEVSGSFIYRAYDNTDFPAVGDWVIVLTKADLSRSFIDIEELADQCKFADCSHASEPGCSVRRAIEAGELSAERLESYRKLQREAGYEGLNSRQLEQKKIESMFGSKGEMKQVMRNAKKKNTR